MRQTTWILFVVFCLSAGRLEAYDKPNYQGLNWKEAEKRVIKGPKSYAAFVSTIPKRNDLLKASFDGSSITMDTRDFYALPDQKKEVMLYLPVIRKEDGVRLKPGETKGEVWIRSSTTAISGLIRSSRLTARSRRSFTSWNSPPTSRVSGSGWI